MEYKEEAIKESIEWFTKDSDNQEKANEDLAKILEVVRAVVDNPPRISKYKALKEIIGVFPE